METVTIPKQEYEELKVIAKKMKKIEQTIHEDISNEELMYFQDTQKAFDFVREEPEIYSEKDVKEKWEEKET